jgi:hypothetical protein
MPTLTRRPLIASLVLALLLPILSACSTPEPTTALALSSLPTAAVATSAPPAAAVVPAAKPAVVSAATPTSTPLPYPTPLPQPPTPTTQAAGPGGLPFPLRSEQLQFGVAAHLYYVNRDAALGAASDVGFGWIRQQIHWRDQEGPAGNYVWGELEAIIQSVNAHNLKLMLSIVRTPSFYRADGGDGLPDDPAALGNFVAALLQRYPGQVQAIEIWNEQNLAHENGGYVSTDDAGHYVEVLKAAYTSIKAVDPSVIVVAGPPASTATNQSNTAISDLRYYRAMYSYQNGTIRNYFDVQAVHPGGSANPPDTMWPDSPSPAQGWTTEPTFYFRHVENVRKLMEEYGMADHQIWITEFGWATQNDTPGFEFGNQVSFDQQAEYIVGAMRRTHDQYPWVGNMFLWNLNFGPLKASEGQPMNEQASFSILNGDWSPRPAYYAIQQYIAGLHAPAQ